MGVKGGLGPLGKGRPSQEERDQVYALKLAKIAKKHSSEAFYALDDPLEAAISSVPVELIKGLNHRDTIEHQAIGYFRVDFPLKTVVRFSKDALDEHLLKCGYFVD
jgi:hypothetical protein